MTTDRTVDEIIGDQAARIRELETAYEQCRERHLATLAELATYRGGHGQAGRPEPEYLATLTERTQRYIAGLEAENAAMKRRLAERERIVENTSGGQTTMTLEEKQRLRFETFAASLDLDLTRTPSGLYRRGTTQVGWVSWIESYQVNPIRKAPKRKRKADNGASRSNGRRET